MKLDRYRGICAVGRAALVVAGARGKPVFDMRSDGRESGAIAASCWPMRFTIHHPSDSKQKRKDCWRFRPPGSSQSPDVRDDPKPVRRHFADGAPRRRHRAVPRPADRIARPAALARVARPFGAVNGIPQSQRCGKPERDAQGVGKRELRNPRGQGFVHHAYSVITGANRGIGLEFARQYSARRGASPPPSVQAQTRSARSACRTARLGDLELVRCSGWHPWPLDLLIANAGTYGPKEVEMPRRRGSGATRSSSTPSRRTCLPVGPADDRTSARQADRNHLQDGSIDNNSSGGYFPIARRRRR